MAYNKKNLYKRIIEIQDITIHEKYQKGLTQKEIYWNIIYPKFKICERTFSSYLGTPAKQELKKMSQAEQSHNQLTLFNI
ncbi:hypothetical protein ACIPCA_12605 [Flavobacterium covae]|uniref:Uncharacterized protein n=1 Tax=Flavobacterium davisii TaxID=2906077 RepID=A0A246GF10_9FLAO|nr:hypothetical protein [Flavobacterium davisii]OWP82693.1 hypothetical protein BWK59_14480 [Flavobacterium davisii]QYS89140.1 hypothetical protein JJC05_01570 [Flavobacterium davisii]